MERTGSSLEFGIRMRGMREAVGLTARDVAILLNCSDSLIYSTEGGYRTIAPMHLSGLLNGPYKRPDMVDYMTGLLDEINSGVNRPVKDSPTEHPSVMMVHELEPRSTAAFGMVIDQIPKLCQLPDYMRAQHKMAGLDPERVEDLTLAGLKRQERFFSLPKPPHTSIIFTESALERGRHIPGQIDLLEERSSHDALTLRVLPNSLGPQPVFCSFTIMDFDEFAGVLWADSAVGGTISSRSTEIEDARLLWDNLSQFALNPTQTVSLIKSYG